MVYVLAVIMVYLLSFISDICGYFSMLHWCDCHLVSAVAHLACYNNKIIIIIIKLYFTLVLKTINIIYKA